MPELPEVQAHAERLTAAYADKALSGFEVLSFTALKTSSPLPDLAVGEPLLAVDRRGKYLLLRFDPVTFVVHLMQGGRLRREAAGASKRPRGALARWSFDGAEPLLLTEAGKERRAGVWVVAGEPEGQPPLEGLGPDATALSVEELAEALGARSVRLHGFLRDQRDVAGLGRRLANEVCHRARLSPFANTAKLTPAEVGRLHEAIEACVSESLEPERARLDMSSSKERPGAVHHRVGEPCTTCGDEVRQVSYTRYTVAYCPTCQTSGRVLADNTTSKFLR